MTESSLKDFKGVINIFSIFRGKICFCVKGIRFERLVNRLRGNVPLWGIKRSSKDTVCFYTDYRYKDFVYQTITDIDPESEIQITGQSGLPVILDRYKKRYGLFLGTALGILLIYASGFFIWQIRVEGNTYVPDNDVKRVLGSLGIREGSLKRKNELDRVYNRFLLNEHRISWISVNFDGMVAHVEVKEAKVVPEKRDRDRNVNIVAKCDGIVKRIDTLDGKPEAMPHETVTKGQLLISAFVDSRKTGTMVRAARGSVWAQTERRYKVYVPKRANVKTWSGKCEYKRNLQVFGKKIPLYFQGRSSFHEYDLTVIETPVTLFDSLVFPFSVITEKRLESHTKRHTFTKQEAEKIAEAELEKRKTSELAKAEIFGTQKNITETEDFFVVEYALSCLEDIGTEQEFEFE